MSNEKYNFQIFLLKKNNINTTNNSDSYFSKRHSCKKLISQLNRKVDTALPLSNISMKYDQVREKNTKKQSWFYIASTTYSYLIQIIRPDCNICDQHLYQNNKQMRTHLLDFITSAKTTVHYHKSLYCHFLKYGS